MKNKNNYFYNWKVRLTNLFNFNFMYNSKIFNRLLKLDANEVVMLLHAKKNEITYNNHNIYTIGNVSFDLITKGKRQKAMTRLFNKNLIEDVNGVTKPKASVSEVLRYIPIDKVASLINSKAENFAMNLWVASVNLTKSNFRNAI